MVLFLHVLKQWLVTKRAKTQWKKYKAMLHDAKAASDVSVVRPPCSPQETTSISGIPSHFKYLLPLESGNIFCRWLVVKMPLS